MITEITDSAEKQAIARKVLEALTEWFEVEESREGYIRDCANWTFLAANEDDKEVAKAQGYEFMQVKTVKMGMYEDYDRTNLFYISCGFKELEVFPLLWDEANPCQIYVMAL